MEKIGEIEIIDQLFLKLKSCIYKRGDKEYTKLRICILIDESSSIKIENFDKIRLCLLNFVHTFNYDDNNSKNTPTEISVIKFGDKSSLELQMTN